MSWNDESVAVAAAFHWPHKVRTLMIHTYDSAIREALFDPTPPRPRLKTPWQSLNELIHHIDDRCLLTVASAQEQLVRTFGLNFVEMTLGNDSRCLVFSESADPSGLLALIRQRRFHPGCRYITERGSRDGNAARDELRHRGLTLDLRPELSLSELHHIAEREKHSDGLDLIVVNDMTRLVPDRRYDNRHDDLLQVGIELKRLAMGLRVPVVLLIGLAPALAHSARVPTFVDLDGVGTIEDESDMFIFLHQMPRSVAGDQFESATQLVVAKSRFGGMGSLVLNYRRAEHRLTDLPPARLV